MPSGNLKIESTVHRFNTQGEIDIIDLTHEIERFVVSTKISHGRVTVFCTGSTGAIICTEFERGLIMDTKRIIAKLVRKGDGYEHDKIDNNAHSHLRSTILGSEITIPIIDGDLALGTWQQVVFVELDIHKRSRKVVFQIMGIE